MTCNTKWLLGVESKYIHCTHIPPCLPWHTPANSSTYLYLYPYLYPYMYLYLYPYLYPYLYLCMYVCLHGYLYSTGTIETCYHRRWHGSRMESMLALLIFCYSWPLRTVMIMMYYSRAGRKWVIEGRKYENCWECKIGHCLYLYLSSDHWYICVNQWPLNTEFIKCC